jgi:Mrp family chromosome partitioning ATPase
MASIIAVLNPKGGCGKTTLAVHLASALSRQGDAVLLVDATRKVAHAIGTRPGRGGLRFRSSGSTARPWTRTSPGCRRHTGG